MCFERSFGTRPAEGITRMTESIALRPAILVIQAPGTRHSTKLQELSNLSGERPDCSAKIDTEMRQMPSIAFLSNAAGDMPPPRSTNRPVIPRYNLTALPSWNRAGFKLDIGLAMLDGGRDIRCSQNTALGNRRFQERLCHGCLSWSAWRGVASDKMRDFPP